MRITHVVDFFHTDLPYQEYHLALQQARAGHDVSVVSSTRRHGGLPAATAAAAAGQAQLDAAGVRLIRLPSRELGHDRVVLSGLGAALDELDPDAVHCHHCFSPTTLLVARWAHRRPVSLLCDSHLSAVNVPGATSGAGRTFYRAWRTIVGPWLRRRVGAFVVNGSPEHAFLAEHLGLTQARVETIPLGFDPTTYAWDPARRRAVRATWGVADDEVVVALTGKHTVDRRTDRRVAAAARLAERQPTRVVVAGSVGPGVRESWASAAPTFVADGLIQELGFLDASDLAGCFLASDVVIYHLSTISAFEAAGTGLPLAVAEGEFARFAVGLGIGATEVDLERVDLAGLLVDHGVREQRARDALDIVGWPVLAARFVDRYRSIPPRGRS